jgi:hypothetical protein
MPWRCFWLEPTSKAEVGLRRYATRDTTGAAWDCDAGWHQALAWLGKRVPYQLAERDDGHWSYPMAETVFAMPGPTSRRWPRECEKGCGYRFGRDDARQVWCEEIYRDTRGREWSLHWSHVPPGARQAGPGAMWDAKWMRLFRPNPEKPDDGIHLMVRCPDMHGGHPNDWCPDSAATGGGFWTRSGDPRKPKTLTVTPSIAIGEGGRDYHGFLTAGVLTDHVG